MGIRERKARQKGEMKDLILKSAHELFVTRGSDEVSIRNIAKAIEYSPTTIYLYFKDIDEIFYGLHQEAFKVFHDFISPALETDDPFERLFAIGKKYLQFASEFPHYYEIMFITHSPMQCEKNLDDWQEGTKLLNCLEGIVIDCIRTGYMRNQDPRTVLFTLWSFLHGIGSLQIRDRLKVYGEDEQEIIQIRSFDLFKQLLQSL
jgi:AcrR family transcriptional regulator